MKGLTGYSGFVGSNLLNQTNFDEIYNSKNIEKIANKHFSMLIVSSIPAVKWYANLNPQKDLEIINQQLELFKSVTADKIALISTIDVYDNFEIIPDEDYKIDEAKLDYYGKHRLYFENKMREIFPNIAILRLPALFGKGLKKNFIYDLLNKAPKMLNGEKYNELINQLNEEEKQIFSTYYRFEKEAYLLKEEKYLNNKLDLDRLLEKVDFTALKFTDQDSSFPYYNLDNIWKDVNYAINKKIPILNLSVEVLSSKEIVQKIYKKDFINVSTNGPVKYHYKSKYAPNGYFYSKQETLQDIASFLKQDQKHKVTKYDHIIIGGGMYGMHMAVKLVQAGKKVLVLEKDGEIISRGSLINQARVHNGYHYPRSFYTANKSKKYYQKFIDEYGFAINKDFTKIYAVASDYSLADAKAFEKFSNDNGVLCEKIETKKYFNPTNVEQAFLTDEFTFDAQILREHFLQQIKKYNMDIIYNANIVEINHVNDGWNFKLSNNEEYACDIVLNTTYAGTNKILSLIGCEPLNIKYELCEVALCKVSQNIEHVGLTLMDGPFFSLMPFGKSGYHSLTSVCHTPHQTSYDTNPYFKCMDQNVACDPLDVQNCNSCPFQPKSRFTEMSQIAKKYLNPDIKIEYVKSYVTLKPILKTSEIDDSRPTLILNSKKNFWTIFSGKINTFYDIGKEIYEKQ